MLQGEGNSGPELQEMSKLVLKGVLPGQRLQGNSGPELLEKSEGILKMFVKGSLARAEAPRKLWAGAPREIRRYIADVC